MPKVLKVAIILLVLAFTSAALFWLNQKRTIQEKFEVVDRIFREKDSLMFNSLNELYKLNHGKSAAYLGHYYLGQNDTASAKAFFERAIDLNEDLLGNYGLALIAGGGEISKWAKINEGEVIKAASKNEDWLWKSRYYGMAMSGYLTGTIDTARAVKFLTTSAEMGNRNAQVKLGSHYFLYSKNDAEKKKSYEWFLKAANAGDVEALTRVGFALEYGDGVEVSLEDAFQFYYKAAMKGNPEAQFHVGRLYIGGQGVEYNVELGWDWLSKSSLNGFTLADDILNSQYVDCPRCNGSGIDVCEDCKGRGTRHCRSCNGYGEDSRGKSCLSCNGNGIVSCAREVECEYCYGYGKGVLETCSNCNGTGEITHQDGTVAVCGEHFNDLIVNYFMEGLSSAFGEKKKEEYCGGDGFVFRPIRY